MSLAQNELAEAFVEIMQDFAELVEISGEPVRALLSKDALESALEEGGYSVTGALTLLVLESELPEPLPTHNAAVLIGGQRYKISEITQDPGSAIIKYRATRR